MAESDTQDKEAGEEYSRKLGKVLEEVEQVRNKQTEIEKQKAELQDTVRYRKPS